MYENEQFINGLLKELCKKGYDYKRIENEIEIEKNGVPIMLLRTNGDNRLHDGVINDCAEEIRSLYKTTKEAYDLYFSAPPLEYENLERYHKLADFKNCVLAACMHSDDSFEFVTWEKAYDKTSLTWGNYFTDYQTSKEDFAARCGLIDRNKLFDETEMKLIRQGLVYLGSNFPDLTHEQNTLLGKVVERIEMLVPEISEHEELERNELMPDDELSL